MSPEGVTAVATAAIAICALLQVLVLVLQWKTLGAQTAFQKTERGHAQRQASERSRLIATLARRSLLEGYRELDRMGTRIEEITAEKFASMAVGLQTVESQLLQIHDYLAEAEDAGVKEMGAAVDCFLRAADRINRLAVPPERMGDTPSVDERRLAVQDSREDLRRAVVHLENATRLTPNHDLSRAI